MRFDFFGAKKRSTRHSPAGEWALYGSGWSIPCHPNPPSARKMLRRKGTFLNSENSRQWWISQWLFHENPWKSRKPNHHVWCLNPNNPNDFHSIKIPKTILRLNSQQSHKSHRKIPENRHILPQSLPTLRVYGDLEILGAPHGCTDIQNSWAAGQLGMAFLAWNHPWLVVWNMFFIFHFIYGMSSENHWRTPSFFRGVGQPPNRSVLPGLWDLSPPNDFPKWWATSNAGFWGEPKSKPGKMTAVPVSPPWIRL